MSPTLDLANDYYRFVVTFMEVISESAPHIYHSALPLSPQTSIVRKRFKPYARPFARVVQGLQVSWEPIVLDFNNRGMVSALAWSPCSKFIAVAWYDGTAEVLDGATLESLNTFKSLDSIHWLSFSPDGRFLTGCHTFSWLTSWDLQTGGQINTTHFELHGGDHPLRASPTHSMDGRVVAAAYKVKNEPRAPETWLISTYNLITGTHVYSHEISEGCIAPPIWTCGDHFRFVTVKPGSISIWQAGFTSIDTPAEVESLPVTNDICRSGEFLFLPALSRLAFVLEGTVLVWDAPNSRFLLKFVCEDSPVEKSFSSDGRFFACQATNKEIWIWKDAPTGYILHQKLVPKAHRSPRLHLSPNGEFIALQDFLTIQLWPTEGPTLSVSTALALSPGFIMEFSPDKSLAAVAQQDGRMVRVLDLTSGDPLLVVDTGMTIVGLRMTESTVVVVGQERVVSWNLPPRDHASCVWRNIGDNIRTAALDRPQGLIMYLHAAISPDLNLIVLLEARLGPTRLAIYDSFTGRRLASTLSKFDTLTWFSPNGQIVWSASREGFLRRRRIVVEGRELSLFGNESLPRNAESLAVFPWRSPHGHEVTANGWVRSLSGKPLLWLPRKWRSDEKDWRWGGRFFGSFHHGLLEAVIFEIFPNDLVRAGL